MTSKGISHGCLGTRTVRHLLLFSTLINGIISNRVHSHSREMEISSGKQPENPGQIHRVDHHRNDNDTIYNGNVLVSTGFDKMLRWIFDNEVDKGNEDRVVREHPGKRSHKQAVAVDGFHKNLGERRFKLGERFAFRKRLQFALLPIMYKMGVMTTLLTGLTVLVLKGLTIGVILLIFAFGNYFTKLHKHPYQSTQPIHVHVHSQDGHSKLATFPSAVGPWERAADEVHPGAYLRDDDVESYRRRLIQNSAAMVKFKPLL